MKSLVFLLVVALLSIQMVSADVVLMSEKNFNVILDSSELALVKFFAPWCGHCQKLAPEYEAAAISLKGKAVLGEVDCTKDQPLCEAHGISGFPTLLLFRYGELLSKFSGPRTTKGLVNFIETYRREAVQTFTSATELENLLKETDAVALLIPSSPDTPFVAQFSRMANKHRTSFAFVLGADASVRPDAPLDKLVVLRKDEIELYEGDGSEESYDNFFYISRVPYIGEISQSTISSYNDILSKEKDSLPFGWLLLNNESPEFVESLKETAIAHRKQLIMVWVNVEKFPSIRKHVGVSNDAAVPAFSVVYQNAHFVFPADKSLNAENVADFIDLSLSGGVEKSIRSEPTPEKDTVDGLTILTANTMDKFFKKTDMLILFYAPWCGHCKKFKPTFAEFARTAASSSLIVAQYDAVANDFDANLFKVEGYPTLYFVTADGKPILYSGDRTPESLQRFVNQHKTSGSETSERKEEGDL